MTTPIKFDIPEGMPDHYKNAYKENQKILESLFSEINENDRLQNILHFLDVFIEVFQYSSKQIPLNQNVVVIKGDSNVIKNCITKYREIFRANFRGKIYLPLAKFHQIPGKAETETLLIMPAENLEQIDELKRIMNVERNWLEKINESRRKSDLEDITTECLETFRLKILQEFPYLYQDQSLKTYDSRNMKYCEENGFNIRTKRVVIGAKKSFKDAVPFFKEEDPKIMEEILQHFENKLEENVLKDLRIRNSAQMTVVQAYMDSIVKKCVDKYQENMTKYLENRESCEMEFEEILKKHQEFVGEFTPQFFAMENHIVIEIGSKDYKDKCQSEYLTKSEEIFQNLVKTSEDNADLELEICKNEGEKKLDNCLQDIGKLLAEYGLGSYSGEFSKYVGEGFAKIFAHVKENNLKCTNALLDPTNQNVAKADIEDDHLALIRKLKKIYVEDFINSLRNFGLRVDYFEDIDPNLLSKCHQKASNLALVETENGEVAQELNEFMTKYLAEIKSGKNIELGSLIRQYFRANSSKFITVNGTDTEIRNGAAFIINTKHQCITVMKQFENKSLEELEFEERTRRKEILDKIIEVVSKPMEDLANNFQKSMDFGASASPGLSPTSPQHAVFQFSSASSSSAASAGRRSHKAKAARRFRQ